MHTLRFAVYIAELVLVTLAFAASYYLIGAFHFMYSLRPAEDPSIVSGMVFFELYSKAYIAAIAVWAAVIYCRTLGSKLRVDPTSEIIKRTIIDGLFFLTVFSVVAVFVKLTYVSRIFLMFYTVLSIAGIIALRLSAVGIAHRLRRNGVGIKDVLLVGSGRRAQRYMSLLAKHPEWGLRIIGLVDRDPLMVTKHVAGHTVIGTLSDLPAILSAQVVDEVMFIVPRTWLGDIEKCMRYCEAVGIPASLSADLFDLEIARTVPYEMDGFCYVTSRTRFLKEGEMFAKRIFDIFAASTALLLASPILIATAAAIKIASPGPVFFKQVRLGMYGRKFVLYKFRSMVVDAEKKIEELKKNNEMTGPVFKLTNDPRITPLGKFLRKTSLDEFPQFWNVLRGHMSIVGPRPPLPSEVNQYLPWHRRRLSVKPGITCLWQVEHRNEKNFEDWMKTDLQYIDNWSVNMDVKILMQTAGAVFTGTGK